MIVTRRLGFGALALGVAAGLAGSPYRHRSGRIDIGRSVRAIDEGSDHVAALELAAWIRDRKPGLRIIDVRTATEFAADAIPTAENLPLEQLMRTSFQPHEVVVLYSEGGAHAGQAWVLLRALGVFNAYFIAGGLADWRDEVMSPVLAPNATPAEAQAFAQAAEFSRYFGGRPSLGPSLGSRGCVAPAVATSNVRRRGC